MSVRFFATYLIWVSDSLEPPSSGCQILWSLSHLGVRFFRAFLIWVSDSLEPPSSGCQILWSLSHLGVRFFRASLIWGQILWSLSSSYVLHIRVRKSVLSPCQVSENVLYRTVHKDVRLIVAPHSKVSDSAIYSTTECSDSVLYHKPCRMSGQILCCTPHQAGCQVRGVPFTGYQLCRSPARCVGFSSPGCQPHQDIGLLGSSHFICSIPRQVMLSDSVAGHHEYPIAWCYPDQGVRFCGSTLTRVSDSMVVPWPGCQILWCYPDQGVRFCGITLTRVSDSVVLVQHFSIFRLQELINSNNNSMKIENTELNISVPNIAYILLLLLLMG